MSWKRNTLGMRGPHLERTPPSKMGDVGRSDSLPTLRSCEMRMQLSDEAHSGVHGSLTRLTLKNSYTQAGKRPVAGGTRARKIMHTNQCSGH